MTTTLSKALRDAGHDIALNGDDHPAARFNAALASILTGYYVGPGTIVDGNGVRSSRFESLIALETPNSDGLLPADAIACAAYVCGSLSAVRLAEAYAHLGALRRLRKTPSTIDVQSTITLSLIVAASASLSLEDLAAEMRVLNRAHEDKERPDMVAVLTSGTIHYGISFPGDDSVADLLPLTQSRNVVPPVNVHQLITETTTHALNKLCGLIIGHLAFFAPTHTQSNIGSLMEGCPTSGAIGWTYRFDRAGAMRDASIAPATTAPAYRIQDIQGTLLCRLAFQQWQDGGVVVAEGSLPLDGLLPAAGRKLSASIFRNKNGHQLSSVLPISEREFMEIMDEIANRITGLTVRQELPQFTFSNILNEGTTSPFVARLYMTPLTLRNHAFTDKSLIVKFDKLFEFTINHLNDVRKTSCATIELWRTHTARVASGEIARANNAIHIDEPIDQPLNKHVNSFVMDAARVSKEFQKLTRLFGVEIGFLFQADKDYEKGLAALEIGDPMLADYVRESRKWLEPLHRLRITMEHHTYVPPRMTYVQTPNGPIVAREPFLLGSPIMTSLPYIENRLNLFIEEILTWCFAKMLPTLMIITEIPGPTRDPNKVERFKVTLADGLEPAWQLAFCVADFVDL